MAYLTQEQQQRRLLLERLLDEEYEEDELSLDSKDVLHKLMSLAFEIKDKIKENDYIQLVDGLKYIHDNPITRTRLQTTFVNLDPNVINDRDNRADLNTINLINRSINRMMNIYNNISINIDEVRVTTHQKNNIKKKGIIRDFNNLKLYAVKPDTFRQIPHNGLEVHLV